MARMDCICGAYLHNHDAPGDIELTVYTKPEWAGICNRESVEPWMIQLPAYQVWRCPACKRVYVFARGLDRAVMVYALDQDAGGFKRGGEPASLACKCGKSLTDGADANKMELIVYSDREWERICDVDLLNPRTIHPPSYDVWRCPDCKRIYVFPRGSSRAVMVYALAQ